MLSSISSFLPSALQIGNDKSPPSPTEQQRQLTASPTKDPDMTGDGSNVKKKKERTNEVRFPISFPLDSGTWQGLARLSGCLRCLPRAIAQRRLASLCPWLYGSRPVTVSVSGKRFSVKDQPTLGGEVHGNTAHIASFAWSEWGSCMNGLLAEPASDAVRLCGAGCNSLVSVVGRVIPRTWRHLR